MLRLFAVLILCASLTGISIRAEAAGESDLNDLLDALARAATPSDAQALESEIWDIWTHAGGPSVDALMDRGIYAVEQGLYPDAEAFFSLIVSADPDLAEGWNKRATVRYLMGDLDGSIADIAQVLVREPRHFGALSGLGLIRLARGEDKAALAAFERVLVIHPQMESAQAHVRLLRDKLKGSGI